MYTESAADHPLVYRFWELRTCEPLTADFDYLILPDACIDLVFDLHGAEDTWVMTPGTAAETVSLGFAFHYVGIRFPPGVYTAPARIVGQSHPLAAVSNIDTQQWLGALRDQPFPQVVSVLENVTGQLRGSGLIAANPDATVLFDAFQQFSSVADIAQATGYSTRQLQRLCRKHFGYRPHDLLKIVRFQQSLGGAWDRFADQSHYIREFKRTTHRTPTRFRKNY